MPRQMTVQSKAENALIRQAVLAAAQREGAKRAFNLSRRGHESRLTLDRSLAKILSGLEIPSVYISGYGANNHYPQRVLISAAKLMKRRLGWSPIAFYNSRAFRANVKIK